MIPKKGTMVGKYRLDAPLAQGGMGAVWTARHVKLDRPVAVKFLAPLLMASRGSLARFEREAHAAAAIQSPHVVEVQDFGVEDDTPYLVMELLRGEDLGARLAREKRLSLAEAAQIAIQVAKGLRHAHAAGIVHRDLKPTNLFLAVVDDGEEVVKILDFGIAKEPDTPVPEQTAPGTMLGSPNYVSPEQAAGDASIDHRSDVWSLAVVLYQMVTGVLPFHGRTTGSVLKKVFMEPPPRMAAVAPDLPPELDAFFAKALAKRKGDRFSTIGDMVQTFVAIVAPDMEVPLSSRRLPLGDIPLAQGATLVSPSDVPPGFARPPAPAASAAAPSPLAAVPDPPTVKERHVWHPDGAAPAEAPVVPSPPHADAGAGERGPRGRRALPWLFAAAAFVATAVVLILRVTAGPALEVRPSAAQPTECVPAATFATPASSPPSMPSIPVPSVDTAAEDPAAGAPGAEPPDGAPAGQATKLAPAPAAERRALPGPAAVAPLASVAPASPTVDSVSPAVEPGPPPADTPPSSTAEPPAKPQVEPAAAAAAGPFDKRWF